MIVTAILSILAMLAVPQLTKARQAAMLTSARADMREALRAVEMYRILNHGALPPGLQQLESVEYHESENSVVCRFEVVTGEGGQDHVAIDIRHSRSRRGVRSQYPLWEGRIDVIELGLCPSVRSAPPQPGAGVRPRGRGAAPVASRRDGGSAPVRGGD